MKTLLLDEKDMRQLLSMKEVIEVVELSFKEKGLARVQMPKKPYLYYMKHAGDLRAMPSYFEELDISAVKIACVHPNNPVKHKLPTVIATIILVNPENGSPLAIMGGRYLTGLRTGAAGGVAAKHLARKESSTIGIVGAGEQARTQLIALKEIFKELEEIRITDIVESHRERYATEMTERLGLNVKAAKNAKEAVQEMDVVVTATPARTPIVKSVWIEAGVHINAIGADAPGKQELDPELLNRGKIVVDDREQASKSGEINIPLAKGTITLDDIWADIGEVVAGLKPGRTSPDEITIFDSTGLAIQDAIVADLAYKKALEKGVGQMVEIT